MDKYVVVGGGISGILACQVLHRNRLDFIALEKDGDLGGRLRFGHHRIYSQASVEFLSSHVATDWIEVFDLPRVRIKGGWTEEIPRVSSAEQFYLRGNYFHPSSSFEPMLGELAQRLGDHLICRKSVSQINREGNELVCQDGVSIPFEKLIWCADLKQLLSILQHKFGANRILNEVPALHGGISLELTVPSIEEISHGTFLFPFVFKSWDLNCIITPTKSPKPNLYCLLFLECDLLQNREEVAKCVRTLKRALFREFPFLEKLIQNERLAYLPNLSGEQSVKSDSLEIFPSIFYVGPQLYCEDSQEGLRNLDLTLSNLSLFSKSLGTSYAPILET